jgi:hypothetical protein
MAGGEAGGGSNAAAATTKPDRANADIRALIGSEFREERRAL